MSGMYANGWVKLLIGAYNFGDNLSAYLIDLDNYAPVLASDLDISYIPDNAILSEANLTGVFQSGLAVFANPITFASVPIGATSLAVVVFVNATLISDSVLVGYYDLTTPPAPDGTDYIVTWPAEGLLVGTI